MRLRLAADAVVLCQHHASEVPRYVLRDESHAALATEVKLLRRDLEQLRAQMARPSAAAAAASAEAADPSAASAAPPPTAAADPTSAPDDSKTGWEDDLAGLFLPEYVFDARILLPVLDATGAALPDFFVLDNIALLAMGRATRAVCFRLSPDLADRHTEGRAMDWGCCFHGQLMNGWLQIALWRPGSQLGEGADAASPTDAAVEAPLRPSPASGSATTNDARVPAIAETIRNLQRRRPDTRLRRAAYCVSHFEGIKDPGRHTMASLSRFLANEIQFLATDVDDDFWDVYNCLR